ncbi:MAG: cytochrome c [Candidatus Binatia bacterium]
MKTILGGCAVLIVLSQVAWAADGAAIFAKKCKLCHSIGGVGGPMAKNGGPLDGANAKGEAYLKDYIKDPKSKKADSKMPKPNLSDEDLGAVVTYLMSLKK